MIATHEPFAPKVRKDFVQKLDSKTAKNSLCNIAFFFTKLSIVRLRAKFSKNEAEESGLGAWPAG